MHKRKRTKPQQNTCICILKLINIFNKALWDTNKDVFGQNSCKKDFSKFSVIVWHGQYCCISQIKTKRVGAWPLWFFSITKHIFDVFNLNSSKSSREKIFFLLMSHYHARYRSEEIPPCMVRTDVSLNVSLSFAGSEVCYTWQGKRMLPMRTLTYFPWYLLLWKPTTPFLHLITGFLYRSVNRLHKSKSIWPSPNPNPLHVEHLVDNFKPLRWHVLGHYPFCIF